MYLENLGLCLSVLGLSSILVVDALPQSVSFGEWKLVRTVTLNGPTNHVQGIEFDADSLWVTSVDSTNRKGYLRDFSLTSGDPTNPSRKHPGTSHHLVKDRCIAPCVKCSP